MWSLASKQMTPGAARARRSLNAAETGMSTGIGPKPLRFRRTRTNSLGAYRNFGLEDVPKNKKPAGEPAGFFGLFRATNE
jgi:hypothetical protein